MMTDQEIVSLVTKIAKINSRGRRWVAKSYGTVDKGPANRTKAYNHVELALAIKRAEAMGLGWVIDGLIDDQWLVLVEDPGSAFSVRARGQDPVKALDFAVTSALYHRLKQPANSK